MGGMCVSPRYSRRALLNTDLSYYRRWRGAPALQPPPLTTIHIFRKYTRNMRIVWQADEQLTEIFLDDVRLDDIGAIESWKSDVFRKLDALLARHGRFPLLICVDGFSMNPELSENYGEFAKHVVTRYASRIARYGRPNLVRVLIATEAAKRHQSPNLFNSRDDAVSYLKQP